MNLKKLKNIKINPIFAFIMGVLLTGGTVYAVATSFAQDVSFTSKKGLVSTNVQDAIDELYEKMSNNTNCPKGYECTEIVPVCKRATTLHTEICSDEVNKDDDYPGCIIAGYEEGEKMDTSTITYGNENTTEGVLNTGDAFTCDVNGDGTFDEVAERFYYVSDLWNKPIDGTDTFDNTYAVLIYYNNVKLETDSGYTIRYGSTAHNYTGPDIAYLRLPNTNTWSNVKLKSTSRQLFTSSGNTYSFIGDTHYDLPVFQYNDKAARFITYQEIENGCKSNDKAITDHYGLEKCLFLFENTEFHNWDGPASSIWLETQYGYVTDTMEADSDYYQISHGPTAGSGSTAIRPAIDVKKTYISY